MTIEDKGVALKYTDEIPQIIAIARGKLLKKLIELAEENNITIYRDPDLAEVLSKLDVGAYIPEDLYRAISNVLAYCYKVNSDFREKINRKGIYNE